MLDLEPIDIIRKNESEYRNNNLSDLTDRNLLVEGIVRHPKIMQRPIIIYGEKAVIGRPPENIFSLINSK